MSKAEVEIALKTKADKKGIDDCGKGFAGLSASGKNLANVVVGLSKKFGALGGVISSVFSNLLRGGIWGAMATVVTEVWTRYKAAQAEAAEAAKRKTQEMIDANAKLVKSIQEAYDKQKSASDYNLSRREKEIDKVKELTKAEIELARQREIAAAKGDDGKISAANASAERQLMEVDMEAAAQKLIERMDAAEERVKRSKAYADMAGYAWEEAEAINQQLKRNYAEKAEEAASRYVGAAAAREAGLAATRGVDFTGLTDEERAKAMAEGRAEFAESKEGRELQKKITDHADKELKEAKKGVDDANETVKKAEDALQDVSDSVEIFFGKLPAAIEKAANAESSAARKIAKEKEEAEKKAADAVARKRKQDAMEEHKQRMADIRKEIAEQSKAKTTLTSRARTVQSEFDKAFAMYRDPARAEAEIGEEKDYRSDLERLHKDARRYGGKWRIDELSSLMAAGDTQGVSDALASWRKSKGFTPQVEAMVRASAAENAKTTVEDELRKLNTGMTDLNSRLSELSGQSSKLAEIASSTSGLAAKVDELLSVKG